MRARTAAALAGAAFLAAACGGTASHPQAAATPARSAAPAHSTPTATTTHASPAASANTQLFAYGLASYTETSISSLRSSVAGPVMAHYLISQSLESGAAASARQPYPAGTVTRIPNGFQICQQNASGTFCQSLTGFRSDSAGRITDLAVDGQLISSRLAAGNDSKGSGLTLSSVTSYLSTHTGNVTITFTVRNTGSQTVGSSNPAFLPLFVASDGSQLNYDSTYSVLPGPLQPGASSAVVAVFDTRVITGQFSLRTNDQTEQILVASEIRTQVSS